MTVVFSTALTLGPSTFDSLTSSSQAALWSSAFHLGLDAELKTYRG